jgi:O-antigen/teichoic acid export membrane protein
MRIKGAEYTGIYTLSFSFTNIFAMIASFGMGHYQLSDVEKKHSDGTFIAARFCTSIAAFLIFLITLPFTSFSRDIMVCSAILMLYRILESISSVYTCVLQKSYYYKTICLSNTLKGILPFLLLCAALYFFNLYAAVLAMCAAYMLVFIFIDFNRAVNLEGFNPKVIKHDIPKLFPPSFMLVAGGLVTSLMLFFPRYIIEKIYTIEELGYFSSITLVMYIFNFLAGPALSVFLPEISIFCAEKKYAVIKRMAFRMTFLAIFITILITLSSFIWGDFALRLVFGEKILSYNYLLPPTLLTSGFSFICNILAIMLVAMQNRIQYLISLIISTLTIILICPVLVRHFYMNGAIYSFTIAYFECGLILLGMLLYDLKIKSASTDNKKG